MNPDAAREEAWRAWLDESMPGESGFRFAWEARGRYDEQRIAGLVPYTQHMALCPAWTGNPCACGLDAALRTLGQPEEVKL